MAGGNTTRRPFTLADLNPHLRRPENVQRQAWTKGLGDIEKWNRGSEGGELEVMKYIAPYGKRAALVEPSNAPGTRIVAPKNAGLGAFSAGQSVLVAQTRAGITILGEPPLGERGVSQAPRSRRAKEADVLVITRAEPSSVAAGSAETITFFGIGFKSSPVDVFEAVYHDGTLDAFGAPAWVPDPDVTIGTVAYTSSTEVSALVTVAAEKPAPSTISVRYARG